MAALARPSLSTLALLLSTTACAPEAPSEVLVCDLNPARDLVRESLERLGSVGPEGDEILTVKILVEKTGIVPLTDNNVLDKIQELKVVWPEQGTVKSWAEVEGFGSTYEMPQTAWSCEDGALGFHFELDLFSDTEGKWDNRQAYVELQCPFSVDEENSQNRALGTCIGAVYDQCKPTDMNELPASCKEVLSIFATTSWTVME